MISKNHVITDFVRMAIKKKKLTNGNETRILHALDCSKGLELIMKKHDMLKN